MSPGSDLLYPNPVQHTITACRDPDYLDRDLSDLSDISEVI